MGWVGSGSHILVIPNSRCLRTWCSLAAATCHTGWSQEVSDLASLFLLLNGVSGWRVAGGGGGGAVLMSETQDERRVQAAPMGPGLEAVFGLALKGHSCHTFTASLLPKTWEVSSLFQSTLHLVSKQNIETRNQSGRSCQWRQKG